MVGKIPEPVLVRDLQRSFKENNINLDAKLVANVLAKNQILLLLDHMKRRKNELSAITKRISRVLDTRDIHFSNAKSSSILPLTRNR